MRAASMVAGGNENTAEELRLAASRTVRDSLRVRAGERFVIVYDPVLAPLALAIERAGTEVGARVTTAQLGTPGIETRAPMLLDDCDVSAFVATYGAPLAVRRAMVDVKGRRRHAHMIGLSPTVIRQSLAADPVEMGALGTKLIARMRPRSTLRVTSPAGSSLRITTSPANRWHNENGLLDGPGWTNLPAGEVITSPASVEGWFVPDGGVWLTDGTELDRTAATRLRLLFEAGRLVSVEGPPEIARALLEHIDDGREGRRVGQVAFGTNAGVVAPIGVSCQDVKLRGLHLILGYTAPDLTGADWNGTRLVQLLSRRASVWVDEAPVMTQGRYTLP